MNKDEAENFVDDDFDPENASIKECEAYLEEITPLLSSDVDTTGRLAIMRAEEEAYESVRREKSKKAAVQWMDRMIENETDDISLLSDDDRKILKFAMEAAARVIELKKRDKEEDDDA